MCGSYVITASHRRCHVGVARGRAGSTGGRGENGFRGWGSSGDGSDGGIAEDVTSCQRERGGEGEEAASCSPGSSANTRVDTPLLTALYHGKGYGLHGHLLHSSRTEIITCMFHQRDWVQTREASGYLDTRNLRMRLNDGTCRKEGNINTAQVNQEA